MACTIGNLEKTLFGHQSCGYRSLLEVHHAVEVLSRFNQHDVSYTASH